MKSPAPSSHEASCHCGRVQLRIAHRPDYMNDCNCSLCAKAGAVWGYCAPEEVEVRGETPAAIKGYVRGDYPDPAVRVHYCGHCDVTTHWTLTESYAAAHPEDADVMAVNMRLFDDAAKTGVELRFPDGAAWDGEGDYGYVREAVVWGAAPR